MINFALATIRSEVKKATDVIDKQHYNLPRMADTRFEALATHLQGCHFSRVSWIPGIVLEFCMVLELL